VGDRQRPRRRQYDVRHRRGIVACAKGIERIPVAWRASRESQPTLYLE
jgi:hypothetical protein